MGDYLVRHESDVGMLQPGMQLEKYRIIEQLATGGKVDVYKAEDTAIGRAVALKILPTAS